MSLLLDALKKAADDKKKISSAESVDDSVKGESVEKDEASDHLNEALSLEAELEAPPLELEDEREISNEPELMLDDAEIAATDSTQSTQDNRQEKKFVISDDGLSLLIHKTNRDIKRNKKILLSSVIVATIFVLVAGGFFYYSEMQAEIATMERKHRIAMQSMHSKTSTDRAPKSSDIIRNLVSDADLDKKVKFAKEHMTDGVQATKPAAKKSISKEKLNNSTATLSIKKTNKVDPVGATLDEAWSLYDEGLYDDAKKAYGKILSIEENNRDALLGLGAISVLKKNNVRARSIYSVLLELDPRDPIATAALASLRSEEGATGSDENYLLSMIENNSEAPHLNFSLANIYAQQNKWSSAQQYYFKAWQGDNDNADYIFNLAVSLDQLDKNQQAIRFYKDSLLKAKDKQVRFSREAAQKRINELLEL